MKPYYDDGQLTVYCGDCREVMPGIGAADAIITDPPYGETSLAWDTWPTGWLEAAMTVAPQMWCFGSLRMFVARSSEFAGWKLAQEVVWEKHNGTGLFNDRFRRVHELAAHFYRDGVPWAEVYKEPQFTNDARARVVRKKGRPAQWIGATGETTYVSEDGGPRLMRSVMQERSCHGRAIHPTQKPEGIIAPLLRYSVPQGGVVCDPFAGSGTTLAVARKLGRRAIGIEGRPDYCEAIVRRLAQADLAV